MCFIINFILGGLVGLEQHKILLVWPYKIKKILVPITLLYQGHVFSRENDKLTTTALCSQIGRNDKAWKSWFDTDSPEESPMPDGYHGSLDTFRKLLMIRAWCPDRVLPQSLKYIAERMGMKYAEGVILNIDGMWEESNIRVPMICFLSMGSDPTNHIEALAKKMDLSKML